MDYLKRSGFVIILAVFIISIAGGGTVKHSSTVQQCTDLPQDTLEAKGYTLVAGEDGCYIYPKDAAQVHETKLLSGNSLRDCSPDEHMHSNGSKCICDRGWYKDPGTLQCSQCTKCCPGAVREIAACVEQDLVDDICALAKPCFDPGPKGKSWQWNEWKPYNYIVYAALGVVLCAAILVPTIYCKRHAIKRVLPFTRKGALPDREGLIRQQEEQQQNQQHPIQ